MFAIGKFVNFVIECIGAVLGKRLALAVFF